MMQSFTLAKYRIKAGAEEDFLEAWTALSKTYAALPEPPVWGTLIRDRSDQNLYYSFGPWRDPDHIKAMRESPDVGLALSRVLHVCEEMSSGDFEVVVHVDRIRTSAPYG
jgi:hypothetical protein